MEFLAKEIIAPYFDGVSSPGVLAAALVTMLVFISGLGAKAIEWGESMGRPRGSAVTRTQLRDE